MVSLPLLHPRNFLTAKDSPYRKQVESGSNQLTPTDRPSSLMPLLDQQGDQEHSHGLQRSGHESQIPEQTGTLLHGFPINGSYP